MTFIWWYIIILMSVSLDRLTRMKRNFSMTSEAYNIHDMYLLFDSLWIFKDPHWVSWHNPSSFRSNVRRICSHRWVTDWCIWRIRQNYFSSWRMCIHSIQGDLKIRKTSWLSASFQVLKDWYFGIGVLGLAILITGYVLHIEWITIWSRQTDFQSRNH